MVWIEDLRICGAGDSRETFVRYLEQSLLRCRFMAVLSGSGVKAMRDRELSWLRNCHDRLGRIAKLELPERLPAPANRIGSQGIPP